MAVGNAPEKAEQLDEAKDVHALNGVAKPHSARSGVLALCGTRRKSMWRSKHRARHLAVLRVPVERTLCEIPVLGLHLPGV